MTRMSLLGIVLSAALIGAACSSTDSSLVTASPPGSDPAPVNPTGSGGVASSSSTIRQPSLDGLNSRTRRRLAPESARIDLVAPTFSDPTTITNPLFPIGDLRSAILLGRLHGRPWRAETTLLPETKMVRWIGQQIETLQSQFVAYLDGRIFEVAVDLYAQADDGSVWYFGEDAFTYEHGLVVDTEGTWVAGVNGPPAMIMPAHPQVGDVYRTENIPGLVFEQVTVKAVGETVVGPTGPVQGAMIAQELHMDEIRLENKYFAPGYGEFFSGGGRTFEETALAVPADVLSQPVPAELESLSNGALDVFNAARSMDWSAASSLLNSMTAVWGTLQGTDVPKQLGARMNVTLGALTRAVGRHNSLEARKGALDAAQAGLDLQMRYRPPVEITLARFVLWTRRLELAATSGDQGQTVGDVETLGWIRDRVALDAPDARRVDDDLRFLGAAAEAGELRALAAAAARLRELAAGLVPSRNGEIGAVVRTGTRGRPSSSFHHSPATLGLGYPKRRPTMRKWVIAGIGAVAVAGALSGGAIAFASNDSEGGVTGPQAESAVQAALEATGGGTANAVERDRENGGVWEVEVRKPDGAIVDVRLDENYQLVVIDGDSETADTNDSGA